jgi:hypothetical protein
MTTNNLQQQESTVPASFELLEDRGRLFLKIHTPGTSTIVEVTDCDLDKVCEKLHEEPTQVR